MKARIVALVATLLTLSGCTTMKPIDFKDTQPKLILEEYFSGRTHAWGLFEDRFGKVRRQFTVDITGTWDGETLRLDEHFTYGDGMTVNWMRHVDTPEAARRAVGDRPEPLEAPTLQVDQAG